MEIEELIEKIERMKTFSFKRFDKEGKVCVEKTGVDINDLNELIAQFKESSSIQSDNVCSSTL